MPELPEVETTLRGISPSLLNQVITKLIVREGRLRLPFTQDMATLCSGQQVRHTARRGKYIIITLTQGALLLHLGMSGHLRLLEQTVSPGKHDHIDLHLGNGKVLRYNDPRRFGVWLYLTGNPLEHPLLASLGVEPLTEAFNGDYLFKAAQGRIRPIKSLIMDGNLVVGVGNIYAAESLYRAGIHPAQPAGKVQKQQMDQLVKHIKTILQTAITAGGTTLKDFYALDGRPGYFTQALQVYGRQDEPCLQCQTPIQTIRIAGRNSAFCPSCQPLSPKE